MAIQVDISHTMNRAVHMNKEVVIENPKIVAHLIMNMLVNISEKFGASVHNPMILALDSKPYWRFDYYLENRPKCPEYDADNFPDKPDGKGKTYKGNRVKDEDFDWPAIHDTMAKAMAVLDRFTDWTVIAVPGAEADDIIAIGSKHFSERGEMVYNITSDKDMKQTQVKGLVEIFDPIKQIFVPEIDVQRFKTLHTMQGDKGDNILAIRPRMAEKTAEKVYPQLDELLATEPLIKEKFEFNKRLVDFDYIPDYIEKPIREKLAQEHLRFDAMKLLKSFQILELAQMADRMARFKLPTSIVKTKLNTQTNTSKKFEAAEEAAFKSFFEE